MTLPCPSVRPSVWLSLAHQRFCLPVSHRPLCPAPSAAFAPSSWGSPASSRRPWHTNMAECSQRSERDQREAGDWDTARGGGGGGGEGYLFVFVPPTWLIPRPHALQLYYFLSERNVTKTSGRNFKETYGRNITSSRLVTGSIWSVANQGWAPGGSGLGYPWCQGPSDAAAPAHDKQEQPKHSCKNRI